MSVGWQSMGVIINEMNTTLRMQGYQWYLNNVQSTRQNLSYFQAAALVMGVSGGAGGTGLSSVGIVSILPPCPSSAPSSSVGDPPDSTTPSWLPGATIEGTAPDWMNDPTTKFTENLTGPANNLYLLASYLSGIGDKSISYSPNSLVSQELSKSLGVREAIDYFLSTGYPDFTYQYTPTGDNFFHGLNAHLSAFLNENSVQIQTGTWEAHGMRMLDENHIFMVIFNKLTLSSLLYHATPKILDYVSANYFSIPTTTIFQEFYLITTIY